MNQTPRKSMSAVKQALVARRLREQSEDLRFARSEPIAVVGLACRTPGGVETPEALWQLLASGTDAISEIPAERWPADAWYDPDPNTPGKINTRFGGFLQNIDRFDPMAFGISPKEARYMDPQQRLLLETAWEAFDDGGMPLEAIRGSRTGVFFGVSSSDYGRMQLQQAARISAYTLSGTASSIATGRLSYLFDLRGPSIAVDTACSSSLVAVHLATQSLRNGDCDIAAAGGVSVNIKPEQTISLAKWGMLAPDGRCKTFDARANGFVRAEGCGVVVLMRLADAIRDGRRIQAVIRGSAVNQDGRSNVLTAPNGEAQRAVLRAALEQASLSPHDVSFVETHGTGTKVGDPIEVEALIDVYSRSRPAENVCHLGAIKANLGHLEAAAGIAGLIKAVLCLRHKAIPPQVHFESLNPLLSLAGTSMAIPVKLTPWETGGRPRVAAISSFGFSGTNAHVLLEEPPVLPVDSESAAADPVLMLPVSAKSAAGAAQQVDRYTALLADCATAEAVRDACFTASCHRAHLPFRLAAVGDSGHIGDALRALSAGPVPVQKADEPKIGFVYSGQGCNWFGMARGLLAEGGVFARTIDDCDAVVQPLAGWSIRGELEAPSEHCRLERTAFFQPALFAIQAALTRQLEHWGLRPFAVAGHSVGEIAAAHAAGILALEDALKLVELRGRLMQQASGNGAMAALGLSAEAAGRRLGSVSGLSIAAANAPEASTVSGDPAAIARLAAELEAEGVFCRQLAVDCAFHSPQMDAYVAALDAAAAPLRHAPARLHFVSTVTGAVAGGGGSELEPGYWGRNMRRPVLFHPAVTEMLRQGCTAFVEIGPHPVLAAYVLDTIAASGRECPVIPALRRHSDDRVVLREAVAALFAHGCDPDWAAIAPRGRVVSLPPYPWQRERYWIDEGPAEAPQATVSHPARAHPLLGWRIDSPFADSAVFENAISAADPPYIRDHRIRGACLLPATAMLEMMASAVQGEGGRGNALTNFTIDEPLCLPDDGDVRVQTGITTDREGTTVRLYSRDARRGEWVMHASSRLADANATQGTRPAAGPAVFRESCDTPVAANEYYGVGRAAGLEFGPAFCSLDDIAAGQDRACGRIRLHGNAATARAGYLLHPVIVDGALQLADVALRGGAAGGEHPLMLPIGIESVHVFGPLEDEALGTATLRQAPAANGLARADVDIFSASGELRVSLRGLQLKQTDADALERRLRRARRAATPRAGELGTYRLRWREAPAAEASPAGSAALIVVAADRATSEAVAAQANEAGHYEAAAALWDATTVASSGSQGLGVPLADAGAVRAALDTTIADCRVRAPGARIDVLICAGSVASNAALPGVTRPDPLAERPSDLAAVLHGLQALAQLSADVGVYIATRGAQATEPGCDCDPEQAAFWGVGSTFLVEHPEVPCTLVDLDPELEWLGQVGTLLDEVARSGPTGERIALRDARRYVCRLEAAEPGGRGAAAGNGADGDTCTRIETPGNGLLDELVFARRERCRPGAGEVEIETRTLGINFRDVLNALGQVDGPAGPALGAECAGTITATGDDVHDFQVGDRVMAFSLGGMASHVVAPVTQVARIPGCLDLAEAATCPVAFLTAKYALEQVAAVQKGEVVLIHAAAGGVGLAAAQVAMQAGARVIATAGSDSKRAYLRRLGIADVFDSRSLSFVDGIRGATADGVDVVLNSLAGEFIPASLSLLRAGGRFVELGKRDDWDDGKVSAAYPGVRYTRFDLGDVAVERPSLMRAMFDELAADLGQRKLHPLPYRAYPFNAAPRAFRRMAQGRHLGKLILSRVDGSARPVVRPDASYLVTGGLGALGLAVAERLAARGARHLVLLARSAGDDEARARVQGLRDAGASVTVRQADVADLDALKSVFDEIDATMPPLKGIVHCAGVLADAAFVRQALDGFRAVMAPKVAGTWNLHELSRTRDLDYFALFSSAAAILGWPGQTNYGAANAAMDGIACRRLACGLPAVTTNWGAWASAGMVQNVRDEIGDPFSVHGLDPHAPDEGVDAFEDIVEAGATGLLVGRFDWARFARRYPDARVPAFLEGVCTGDAEAAPVAQAESTSGLLDELQAVLPAQRRRVLEQFLAAQAAKVLGLPPTSPINRKMALNEQGLDSLLAVEMRNAVSRATGRSLPASLLFDHPSVVALARHLLENVLGLPATSEASPTDNGIARLAAVNDPEQREIENMTDEEAERLLSLELDEVALERKAGGLVE